MLRPQLRSEIADKSALTVETEQTGGFIQDTRYRPFGESIASGATLGSLKYTSEHWNGGDLLAAFGLVQLGALNDPQNLTDPTGLSTATPSCPTATAASDPINVSRSASLSLRTG